MASTSRSDDATLLVRGDEYGHAWPVLQPDELDPLGVVRDVCRGAQKRLDALSARSGTLHESAVIIRELWTLLRELENRGIGKHMPPEPRVIVSYDTAERAARKAWEWLETCKVGAGNGKRTGRRGRTLTTDPEEDEAVADAWNRARSEGIAKKDFAKDSKLSIRELDRILNRTAKRRARKK
jgi:hypothetical protein